MSSSLSDFVSGGAKSTAAVYFSPFSYPISRYWDAKPSKTIRAGADFRFRRPKSDRLLAVRDSGDYKFPHIEDFAKASPFKKMAYFFVLFTECAPIEYVTYQTGVRFESDLEVRNYENSFYALNIALTG